MGKLVLDVEINEKFLKDNCIIIYKNKKWQVISKESFLAQIAENQRELKADIEKININISEFKNEVNKKLKEHHNILQVLSKEE